MKYVLNHEGKMYRKFFEEIAAIPHESFKEKALSDYIVQFARERALWYHQDKIWNVIVKKPASPGYEDHEPVMIQGHIDMVCVKTPGSVHNFDKDPLNLYVEDGFLKARETTLGADCGHGISYMLSILDDKSLKHPPLECLFTVQEEVGIGGPKQLDYSLLSAKRMIFTDSMKEGCPELSTTSVLGGTYKRKVRRQPCREGRFFELRIEGLSGGHAAVDINKGRANGIKLLARAAYNLRKAGAFRICALEGGTLKNNLADKAKMTFLAEEGGDFEKEIRRTAALLKEEYRKTEPGLSLQLTELETPPRKVPVALEDSKTIINWLMEIPSGTYCTDPQDPSFPLTSRNLGTAELTREALCLGYMYRTSIPSHLELLFDEQKILCEMFGAEWKEEYSYPGYTKEPGSPLYQVYETVYREFTGKHLTPVHIHAGTDVGTILRGMGGDMDIIGIGPNTYKFHTPDEALELASYDRAYVYMVNVLERL